MKRNIVYIIIILIIFLGFNFYLNIREPERFQVCPEDYPDTDVGIETKTKAINEWVASFRKNNPNASLTDFAKARYRFYVENKCDTTLENYYESEDSESDTEEEKIMRAIIKSEIDDQAMKNLIEGLKNQ